MTKGFTLIELLAVIVILAVLALIATPIVLNIIDDSKKNATLRSSENYIKAIEFSIAKSVMENKRLSDGEYPIMSNGNICLGTPTGSTCDNELIVEVSGETPESGTVTIKSRKIDSYEFTYASGFVVINGEIQEGDVIVQLAPGLYDEDNNLISTWEELTTVEHEYDIDGITQVTTTELIISESGELQTEWDPMMDNSLTAPAYGKLVIKHGITSIGINAFNGSGLTSITIPSSVTNLKAGAFEDCYNLLTINFIGTEEEWNSISFANDWDLGTPEDMVINYNYKG